jgi:ribosomal protein S27AE
MRSEFLIIGLILIIVGIGLAVVGYDKMQPTSIEKTAGLIKEFTEGLTGEKLPDLPKRDTTGPTLMMILGAISFIVGLVMIIKSGRKEQPTAVLPQKKVCPNCGTRIFPENKFCPNCGREIE